MRNDGCRRKDALERRLPLWRFSQLDNNLSELIEKSSYKFTPNRIVPRSKRSVWMLLGSIKTSYAQAFGVRETKSAQKSLSFGEEKTKTKNRPLREQGSVF